MHSVVESGNLRKKEWCYLVLLACVCAFAGSAKSAAISIVFSLTGRLRLGLVLCYWNCS